MIAGYVRQLNSEFGIEGRELLGQTQEQLAFCLCCAGVSLLGKKLRIGY